MQQFPACNQHLAVWDLPLLNLQLAQLMHHMPNHLFSYYILMFAFNNKISLPRLAAGASPKDSLASQIQICHSLEHSSRFFWI